MHASLWTWPRQTATAQPLPRCLTCPAFHHAGRLCHRCSPSRGQALPHVTLTMPSKTYLETEPAHDVDCKHLWEYLHVVLMNLPSPQWADRRQLDR